MCSDFDIFYSIPFLGIAYHNQVDIMGHDLPLENKPTMGCVQNPQEGLS